MNEQTKNDTNEEACGCGCGCGHDEENKSEHSHDECGCGHDHSHEHYPDVITLTLDDNKEVKCAVLGIFDVEDQDYIALLPEEGDDVFLYIYHESEEGHVSLENIESQEQFDKVSAVFLEIIENENEDEEEA